MVSLIPCSNIPDYSENATFWYDALHSKSVTLCTVEPCHTGQLCEWDFWSKWRNGLISGVQLAENTWIGTFQSGLYGGSGPIRGVITRRCSIVYIPIFSIITGCICHILCVFMAYSENSFFFDQRIITSLSGRNACYMFLCNASYNCNAI